MICPTGEAKYFCKRDWTTQITLIRFNNFCCARTTMPSSLRENVGIAPRCSNPPLHRHAEFMAHDSRLQFRSLNHVRRGAAHALNLHPLSAAQRLLACAATCLLEEDGKYPDDGQNGH